MNFKEKLVSSIRKRGHLCIGLDPNPELSPDVLSFLEEIIDATRDIACAYKLNLAFYEAMGLDGIKILERVRKFIPEDIPAIGDGKRGDIGVSSKRYADFLFNIMGFDAITVSPYMGKDSLEPFFEFEDKGIFVLTRTTNNGARDFQELSFQGKPLYLLVAERVREWNKEYRNLGVVVGATDIESLRKVKEVCHELPFLVPGVGAQGGDLEGAVGVLKGCIFVISSSRSILYPEGMNINASRSQAFKLKRRIEDVLKSF